MPSTFTLLANRVDIQARRIYRSYLTVNEGRIERIEQAGDEDPLLPYAIPGFVDAHVHIESSLLSPSQFARLAVVHGTVGTVSDPHEIANVCGERGIEWMLEDAARVPFHFCFGAPSCVPATTFETAGATLDAEAVERLLERDDIYYLSEVMNFPGVIAGDGDLLSKMNGSLGRNKPVDGHAPGLRGEALRSYVNAARDVDWPFISTDHECYTAEEAEEKLRLGMKVLIREGSAAKNFDALISLLPLWHERLMFCSDDLHPDLLLAGHIDRLCARAVAAGCDPFQVLRVACLNPVAHYRLPIGGLQPGDAADFILIKNLKTFQVTQTYLAGVLVADEGKSLLNATPSIPINHWNCRAKRVEDFYTRWVDGDQPAIRALDGQLITLREEAQPGREEDAAVPNVDDDLLKLCVVNRYADAPVATAWIRGFGLQRGALASSVAHDSHNIVAVGTSDESICAAVNAVIREKGGLAVVEGESEDVLPLPVAGLMSNGDGYAVAAQYAQLDKKAKALGSPLGAPFMTLSFMALLVIPELKLSDKGLFDGKAFQFVET